MYALFNCLLHHGSRVGDAGRLDNFIGIEYFFFRMLSFLIGNLPFLKFLGILFLDLSLVAQEHIKTFHFGQNCGTDATFGTSQYYYS